MNKEIKMKVGDRVKLRMYPYCEGVVIDVQEPLTVKYELVRERYKVRWDDPLYGESGWLTDNDTKEEK